MFVSDRHVTAAIAFACACLIRSNGAVYAGFFIWKILRLRGGIKVNLC